MKICKQRLGGILLWLLIPSWFFLFYKQGCVPHSIEGLIHSYGSDLPEHIFYATTGNKHYSIYYYILGILNRNENSNVNIICTALFLTVLMICTVFATEGLFSDLFEAKSDRRLLAILMLFTASIALPIVFPFFYYGQTNTQPWHNGPYIMMRLFSVLMMIQYMKVKKTYLDETIPWKDLGLFMLFCMMSCISKPSYIMVFLPVMFCGLLSDLCRNGFAKIGRQFIFGSTVIPTLVVFGLQYLLIFGKKGSEMGNEMSGFQFGLSEPVADVLPAVILKLIFGLAFPLYVLWSSDWQELKKLPMRTGAALFIVAFLEDLLIHETGERAGDGNFGWGLPAAAYFLMTYSCISFLNNFSERSKWDKLIGSLLMSMHYISGILYFILVLCGEVSPSSI